MIERTHADGARFLASARTHDQYDAELGRMTACFDPTHPQTPENPERLTGPEVGSLCRIVSKYDWLADRIVRVLERSYVWAPEQHNPNGTHGSRRYMDAVIEYGPGKRLVVLQSDLVPLEPGDVILR